MTCEQTSLLLSAYLDGELPVHRADEVERLLGECAACRDEYAALREARELLGVLPTESSPPSVRRGLRRRLRRRLVFLAFVLGIVLLLVVPSASVLVLALRDDLPLWARAGFLASGLCLTAALGILCYQLLTRVRSLVAYSFLAGERTA